MKYGNQNVKWNGNVKQKIKHQLNKNHWFIKSNKLLIECYNHGSFNCIANKAINSTLFQKQKTARFATEEIIL